MSAQRSRVQLPARVPAILELSLALHEHLREQVVLNPVRDCVERINSWSSSYAAGRDPVIAQHWITEASGELLALVVKGSLMPRESAVACRALRLADLVREP